MQDNIRIETFRDGTIAVKITDLSLRIAITCEYFKTQTQNATLAQTLLELCQIYLKEKINTPS